MSDKNAGLDVCLADALYLEELLLRQMDYLRQYDLDNAMALAEQAQPLAERVKQSGLLDRSESQEISQRLEAAYRQLLLMIANQRQEVAEKLAQVRDGIKTLSAYSESD